MGMFDYLTGLVVKCPVCGKKRDRDWQVKGFAFQMWNMKVGDKVDDRITSGSCIGNCPICNTQHYVEVFVKDGIITDKHILFNSREEWIEYISRQDMGDEEYEKHQLKLNKILKGE